MKNIVIIFLVSLSFPCLSQQIDLMTFNIRYDTPNDGEDQWLNRKTDVVNLIDSLDIEILGIQEAVFHQLAYIDSASVNHAYIGVGRDDGELKGEFSAILYDTTQLELLDFGTFWLSPTPQEVSTGWDAALPRVCTFGLFKEKESEKLLWVYNTHFDHIGQNARLSSAATIVQHLYKNNISDSPVILMGDLNAQPNEAPLELLSNHFNDPLTESTMGTFWGFDLEAKAQNRIDYILGKNIDFLNAEIIETLRPNGRHISDHLPVLATISLEE